MGWLLLLDLTLTRKVALLPDYFLLVVRSAGMALSCHMFHLIDQTDGLAFASRLYWRAFPSSAYLIPLLSFSLTVQLLTAGLPFRSDQ